MRKEKLDYLLKLVKENKKPDSQISYEICIGLSEVCLMLSKSKESTESMKRDFLKFSKAFKSLSIIHKSKVESKKEEDEKMTKKLTEQEKEEREVRVILAKIKKLEKSHQQYLVERACFRYKNANLDRRKAEKEIKEHEQKLEDAKRRLR